MNLMQLMAVLPLMLAPTVAMPSAPEATTRAEGLRLTAELNGRELGHGRAVYTQTTERRTLTARVAVRLELRQVRIVVGGSGYDVTLNEEGIGTLEVIATGKEGMPTLHRGDTVEVMAGGHLLMVGKLAG